MRMHEMEEIGEECRHVRTGVMVVQYPARTYMEPPRAYYAMRLLGRYSIIMKSSSIIVVPCNDSEPRATRS